MWWIYKNWTLGFFSNELLLVNDKPVSAISLSVLLSVFGLSCFICSYEVINPFSMLLY
jgi:hypothetical protein